MQIKVPSACNELGEFAIIQLRRRKLKADITSVSAFTTAQCQGDSLADGHTSLYADLQTYYAYVLTHFKLRIFPCNRVTCANNYACVH